MKYKIVEELSSQYPIEKMCQVLEISRSSYYEWKTKPMGKRAKETAEIVKAAKESHEASRGISGGDKILIDVREKYPSCSRNRLYRLLKENGLRSKRRRKFKATTNSNHALKTYENHLNQEFEVKEPNKVWVSDITYIHTNEGWLYLAIVKDLCTKKVVGWATDDNMKTELCLKALNNAITRYRPTKGYKLTHHSDRGVQYCSNDYQKALEKNEIKCSMSRKGNCYDNACAETFFSTIKCEMIYHNHYKTREEARQDIFWYIEIFYNRSRKNEALGYKTPEKYERDFYTKTPA